MLEIEGKQKGRKLINQTTIDVLDLGGTRVEKSSPANWKHTIMLPLDRVYEKLQHRIELYTPQFDQGKTMENQNGYLWLLHFWNSRFFYVFVMICCCMVQLWMVYPPPKNVFFPPLTLVLCDSGRDNQLRVKSPPTPKKWMAKYTTNHRLWKSRDAIPQLRASSNNNSIRVDLGGQEACRNCSDPEIPYCGWTSHPLKQVPSGNLT